MRLPKTKLGVTLTVIALIGFVMLGVVLYYAFTLWGSFSVPNSPALQALGCDLTQVAELGALSERTAQASGAQAVVMCLVGPGKPKRPACEDVARTYADIAPPGTQALIVVVGILGDDRTPPSCSGVYDVRGTRLGDMPQ